MSLVKRFAWPVCLRHRLGKLDARNLRYSDTATVAARYWFPGNASIGSPALDPEQLRDEAGNWNGQWLHWPQRHFDATEPRCPDAVWAVIREKRHQQGLPPTYYAILMADGDHLGKLLIARGEQVSRALSRFALKVVRGIIRDHQGELIYSGGDDTLALLPTEKAIACAQQVQRSYAENWLKHFPKEQAATLSTGLAVVHHKEDLRFALDRARDAEQLAKRSGRNALALAICRRSGEHSEAVLGWQQTDSLQQLVEQFRVGMSDRWAYRLRALLPTLEGREIPWEMFTAELQRLLRRMDGASVEHEETFAPLVLEFFDSYRAEMTRTERMNQARERDEATIKATVLRDFVVLCQSASFLARGRDAR